MDQDPIRIVLIDGHRLVVEPLMLRLNDEPGMEVVATATNGERGLPAVIETRPHVVVLSFNIEGPGPFELATTINQRLPETRFLYLTAFLSDILVDQALRLPNTRGYLLKSESVESLTSAIRRVAGGEYCFSPQVQSRLVYDAAEQRYTIQYEGQLKELTTRQLEVLRRLAAGESVKEVARALNLSEKSVDSHKYRIMNRLGIHDRVGLARYAIREGLLLP